VETAEDVEGGRKPMAAEPIEQLPADDARKTYRYLRIGMIGAVVLLAVAIGIERTKVDCFQTAISAYYYTPVRAIFVGSLIAVGLALIVYKGSTWEDLALNFAGMLAPVVAVAPTTDVGICWSRPLGPRPFLKDGSLAPWVVTTIDNNFYALLIAGFLGLSVAVIIAITEEIRQRGRPGRQRHFPGKTLLRNREWWSLGTAFLLMLLGWWLIQNWGDFNTRAHGFAAVLMIVFLGVAIIAHAIDLRWPRRHHAAGGLQPEPDKRWPKRDKRFFWIYMVIAALMAVGGILIWLTRWFDQHTVFALEAYEIGFFALYWGFQTKENWHEKVVDEPVGDEGSRGKQPAAPRAEGR
jgi:putative Mn2+ efflux pump MntP